MKATINEVGRLIIQPETSLEVYALNNWRGNYMQGDNDSVLECVDTLGESDGE